MAQEMTKRVVAFNGPRAGQSGTLIDYGTAAGPNALIRWDDGAEESYTKVYLLSEDDPHAEGWQHSFGGRDR